MENSTSSESCQNTDNGAKDSLGDDCTWFEIAGHSRHCGQSDSVYFNAKTMCCACGGGSSLGSFEQKMISHPDCKDSSLNSLDDQKEGCMWYDTNSD